MYTKEERCKIIDSNNPLLFPNLLQHNGLKMHFDCLSISFCAKQREPGILQAPFKLACVLLLYAGKGLLKYVGLDLDVTKYIYSKAHKWRFILATNQRIETVKITFIKELRGSRL